jgi:hypothetical protein
MASLRHFQLALVLPSWRRIAIAELGRESAQSKKYDGEVACCPVACRPVARCPLDGVRLCGRRVEASSRPCSDSGVFPRRRISSLNISMASAHPSMNGSVIESCCALLDDHYVVFVGKNEM